MYNSVPWYKLSSAKMASRLRRAYKELKFGEVNS